ncbi:MAG TPA: SH3 domain-containing protein [Kofleriaceae bacterium]|nr:SH3 domain-containing protein [Kofleriaceae bacterium]
MILASASALALDIDAAADPAREARDRRAGDRTGEPIPAPPGAPVTTIETPLYARAGESSRRIGRLARGTPVDIVARKGRWLEVRAAGARGWLPRSTIEQRANGGDRPRPADREPAEPGERPGFRAHTAVRAGAARRSVWMDRTALVEVARAGAARAEPDAASPPVFEVAAGAELRLAGQARGEWSLVETPDGTVGWLPAVTLRAAAGGRARPPAAPAGEIASEAAEAGGQPAPSGPDRALLSLNRPSWVRARAAVGVSTFDMDFSSNGSTPLAAYRLSASAMAAFASMEAGMTRGRLRGSVDAGYGVTVGVPGIRVQGADGGTSDPLAFTWHHVEGGVRLGYQVAGAFAPHVRAGYHYDWFRIGDVTNPGKLARDGLRGFVVGVGADVAPSDDLVVRVGGETLVGGGRKQTPGLEDGLASSALAFWGRLEASYLASDSVAVEGSYQYGWCSTDWDGQSPRQADVTSAERTDHSHLLLVSLRFELSSQ